MRSRIISITTVVCLTAITQGLNAQGTNRTPGAAARQKAATAFAAGLAPEGNDLNPSGQYSGAQLEDLRAQLMSLTDAVEQSAILAPPGLVDASSLQQSRAQIQQMAYDQLNTLRRGISPTKLKARLTPARERLKAYADAKAQGTSSASSKLAPRFTDGSTFPAPSGFCNTNGGGVNTSSGGIGSSGGSGTPPTVTTGTPTPGADQNFTQDPANLRIPTAAVIAADVIRFTADAVREFSQDACKEEILGFNASLVCIAVDALWVIADAVDEGIHFCDDDLTASVIDTSYNGLADVHTDLYTIGTSLDTHVGSVDTHITNANTDIDSKISNANTDIDLKISTANADIDTKIANLDTHLVNVDNHIQAELTTLTNVLNTLIANLSTQVGASTAQLTAGEQQIMKLLMTPDGLKALNLSILTCDGSAAKPCPSVLAACLASGKCAFNVVGPLP